MLHLYNYQGAFSLTTKLYSTGTYSQFVQNKQNHDFIQVVEGSFHHDTEFYRTLLVKHGTRPMIRKWSTKAVSRTDTVHGSALGVHSTDGFEYKYQCWATKATKAKNSHPNSTRMLEKCQFLGPLNGQNSWQVLNNGNSTQHSISLNADDFRQNFNRGS